TVVAPRIESAQYHESHLVFLEGYEPPVLPPRDLTGSGFRRKADDGSAGSAHERLCLDRFGNGELICVAKAERIARRLALTQPASYLHKGAESFKQLALEALRSA